MTGRLVFHLGDPKTGTTSIQETLAAGNWRGGASLVYPARINHLPLAKCLYDKAETGERAERFTRLAQALGAADADIGVISAELFEHVDPLALKAAIAEFLPEHAESARFIAYVRPHADRLVSAWAERMKQGFFAGDLETLHENTLARGHFLYAPRFLAWRETFGARFHLRPMIRDRLKDGDVVADFLDFVFEGAAFDLIEAPGSNPSLCLEDLVMLREFHLAAPADPELAAARRAVGWNFAAMLATRPRRRATPPRLHRALAERVAADYAEDAAALDAAFFKGGPMRAALDAAPAKAVAAAQSNRPEDHFDAAEIRMIRAWIAMLGEMLRHDPERLPEHFRARQARILAGRRRRLRGAEAEA